MTVLIVEDEPELAELISIHVEKEGRDAQVVHSGEAALREIAANRYEMVLLDLVLPGIGGKSVLEAIRREHSRTALPVIVVSGLQSDAIITGALRNGANDYVVKPVNMDLLMRRVETISAAQTADRRALKALRGTNAKHPEPIGHCKSCETSILRSTPFCPNCGAARPDPEWPTLATAKSKYLGKMIDDRYFVERIIARGGQGEVYKVLHTDLERYFAAKFVNIKRDKPERTDAVRERIVGEIRALASIQSPHVVRIHDVIQIADTIFALVMDFVNGRSVEAELNTRRRLPLDEAIDIARQTAQGLVEAHQMGFVHRDIKPNNIMMEDLPGGGRFIRILDFGFVHTLGRRRDPNRFEGTVGYSAPEQLTAASIDRRADIYALGITLFDMVTGTPPYSGKPEAVVDGHVYGEIPRITDKLGKSPAVVALEQVVRRMLAKKPEDRYQDLFEVIRVLDDVAERHGLRV